jgi:hypothetical protein
MHARAVGKLQLDLTAGRSSESLLELGDCM